MAQIYNALELNKNEIRNPVFHNLSLPPSSPKRGQVYFDISMTPGVMYYWSGDAWVRADSDNKQPLNDNLTALSAYTPVTLPVSGPQQVAIDDASAADRDRANHSGTQLAATISDFSSSVNALLPSASTQSTVTTDTNYTVTPDDTIVLCDTVVDIVITLPTAASVGNGKTYVIKNTDIGKADIIVVGGGLIDAEPIFSLLELYAVNLVSNGISWWIY